MRTNVQVSRIQGDVNCETLTAIEAVVRFLNMDAGAVQAALTTEEIPEWAAVAMAEAMGKAINGTMATMDAKNITPPSLVSTTVTMNETGNGDKDGVANAKTDNDTKN